MFGLSLVELSIVLFVAFTLLAGVWAAVAVALEPSTKVWIFVPPLILLLCGLGAVGAAGCYTLLIRPEAVVHHVRPAP